MGWEFCIYSVTYFKNNLFAPDDCGSCFSFHRPRRSATILYWRPGMDRCLDERLHSMQPQIAVMWIKERLCGLMRGYVIWRGVFNIRRDWETWREVAKQKESSKIHTCGEKLGCKTWDGVRDSIHEFYDCVCSLDLFIFLKQGWPDFVFFSSFTYWTLSQFTDVCNLFLLLTFLNRLLQEALRCVYLQSCRVKGMF